MENKKYINEKYIPFDFRYRDILDQNRQFPKDSGVEILDPIVPVLSLNSETNKKKNTQLL